MTQIDIDEVKEVIIKNLCSHLMDCGYSISTPSRMYGPEVRIKLRLVDIYAHLVMEDEVVHFPIQEHWRHEQNSGYNTSEYVPLDLSDPDGLDKSYAKIVDAIKMIEKRGPSIGSQKSING